MTDRINGFTVTLEHDIRDDDVQPILDAVQMIKGVIHVEPNIVTDTDHFARMRVEDNIRSKLYEFIKENLT